AIFPRRPDPGALRRTTRCDRRPRRIRVAARGLDDDALQRRARYRVRQRHRCGCRGIPGAHPLGSAAGPGCPRSRDLPPGELGAGAAGRQAATRAADRSVERFELRVTKLPLRRALISTVEVAGCGIGTVRTEPPATPARAGSTTLENGRLRCRVETDGTLSVD